VKLRLRDGGGWEWNLEDSATADAIANAHEAYIEAVPRYFEAFEELFATAQDRCEFEFILALLRVKGDENPGWDPYETTGDAFARIGALVRTTEDFHTRRHLELWLYGHIVEATEPHSLIANMLSIALGRRYTSQPFPPKRSKGGSTADLTGGERIRRIVKLADEVGLPNVAAPLTESWDRVLRNAVSHSDYCLSGDEVHILKPARNYTDEQWTRLLNHAAAYHESLTKVHQGFVSSYDTPARIECHPDFAPGQQAEVLVAPGYGLVGLRDCLTEQQLRAGAMPWVIGRSVPMEPSLPS
jgi:hypothetical protein